MRRGTGGLHVCWAWGRRNLARLILNRKAVTSIMPTNVPNIQLNDGHAIPQLGFGVWQVPDDEATQAVRDAVEAGYRLIDTAEGYDNEEGVGRAIKECGIAREELFITSKLRNGAHAFDEAIAAFDETQRKLGLEYLDMFLIHWPVPEQDKYLDAWKALVQLREQGRIRSIGVSNFLPEHLDKIIDATGVVPVVNQIELHPKYQQRDIRDVHQQRNIAIECYSPLGSGAVLEDETINAIAQKHSKTVAQVILRYLLDQDLIVIPKSTHADRIQNNIDVFGFSLDDDDRQKIDGLDDPQNGKTGSHPATMNSLF
jgi:2,5-diketo-D-gluconate reductase A